jgi:hypothetical protein
MVMNILSEYMTAKSEKEGLFKSAFSTRHSGNTRIKTSFMLKISMKGQVVL